MTIVVFGLPGSGKSYFARRLAKELDAEYISSDEVRNGMRLRGKYSFRDKRKVYNQMIAIGLIAERTNKNVVFDGTFYLKKIRNMIRENFDDTIHFIEVTASEELIKSRTQKERPLSDADYGVYRRLKQAFQPMTEPHLKIGSTNENLEEMIRIAKDTIKTD